MKKRILSLMLTCMTVLSLVACGGNETETETNDNVTTDTVVTEDAPMDAPVDVPVEKENWTDMVVTVNVLDLIGRPSAESYVLKECTHNDIMADRRCGLYKGTYLNSGEKHKVIWTNEDLVYGIPYATISVTCFSDTEVSADVIEYSVYDAMASGIKVTSDPTIKKQDGDWRELALPAGITCGSTIAEVEAAYGTPTSTDVTAESCTVYRYDDADKHLVLEFDANSTVHSFEYYYDLNGYTEVE